MNKQELAERLARRSRQSKGNAADTLDDLVYKLWKESRNPKQKSKAANPNSGSRTPAKTVPAKKS